MRKFRNFKPYYNWNTFNTELSLAFTALGTCFKPYYNWNTFNTGANKNDIFVKESFKPYYNWNTFNTITDVYVGYNIFKVLNLIITGIPSILKKITR